MRSQLSYKAFNSPISLMSIYVLTFLEKKMIIGVDLLVISIYFSNFALTKFLKGVRYPFGKGKKFKD